MHQRRSLSIYRFFVSVLYILYMFGLGSVDKQGCCGRVDMGLRRVRMEWNVITITHIAIIPLNMSPLRARELLQHCCVWARYCLHIAVPKTRGSRKHNIRGYVPDPILASRKDNHPCTFTLTLLKSTTREHCTPSKGSRIGPEAQFSALCTLTGYHC